MARLSHSIIALVALVVVSALAAACGGSTSPSGPAFSTTDTCANCRVGTGTDAVAGKSLTVTYTGWLYDPAAPEHKGLLFDTSTGRSPLVFNLGTGEVIPGWDQGIVGMKVGGIRQLVIPPSLAYGAVRAGAIPPNSTLVFEVELLNVD